MRIPTEPVGSIPRPRYLLDAMRHAAEGLVGPDELDAAFERAVRETIAAFEATDSPVITDGEQTKPSFATYPVHGATNLAPDGAVIPFADGHTRQLPRLVSGPFKYSTFAGSYLARARKYATRPLKQAVIAPSALSLLYPQQGLPGYAREQFVDDLVSEAEADVRSCFAGGAHSVQLDFTEGRLSLKLDPTRGLLRQFIDLNNVVLARFSDAERLRLGVHTCPGGDKDSTHSADIDYASLLPDLFRLNVTNFFIQLASEPDRTRVLTLIKQHARPFQRIFVGVTDPISPRVERAEEVAERVLEAARYIAPERLGTTDDCGFSPFADDTSTTRDIAFAKVVARVAGTALAERRL
jgi:5-methyltetrahydropteroyltriglutamate--homocysteine methyltransferase